MQSHYTKCQLIKICGMPIQMMIVLALLVVPNWVFAQGDQKTKQSKSSVETRATDMTGGQQGLVEEYDVVPVPRGALVDEKGAALITWLKTPKARRWEPSKNL